MVVSEHRPVPLWQHMLVGRRMFDLFHDADAARKHDVHPELLRYTREMDRRLELTDRSYGPGSISSRYCRGSFAAATTLRQRATSARRYVA